MMSKMKSKPMKGGGEEKVAREKTVDKHFRISVAEAELLKKQAVAKNGGNESEYFRMLLSHTPSDYPDIRDKLDKLLGEVHKIGVNINQIAYACNVNPLFYDQDRDKLMLYMQECRKLLLEVVKYCNSKNDVYGPGEGQ